MLKLIQVSGAFTVFRLLNRHRALILTYHRFYTNDHGVITSASAFSEQLAYLKAHYRVVPLSQIVEQMSLPGEPQNRLAAITIDDGYRDAYEIAFPLLRRYSLPATLFVVTEFVERRVWLWPDKMRYLTSLARPQELVAAIEGRELRISLSDDRSREEAAEKVNSELKRLSDEAKDEAIDSIAASLDITIPQAPPEEYASIGWDQAREMDAKGVEIGSHTMTHPILTNIGDTRLRCELSESRNQIEAVLRRPVEHFCYPNGDYDERVRKEAVRAGYRCAVTSTDGLNATGHDLFTLRRINTERDMTHFMQSTSGFELMKNRMRFALKNNLEGAKSDHMKIGTTEPRIYTDATD
ncbi:MAG: polysaccharide deacetylase family protein [Acidobacteria bacterium]|nr:polysaccharide deacetylase family protein [Acidobacteriota bacterium]